MRGTGRTIAILPFTLVCVLGCSSKGGNGSPSDGSAGTDIRSDQSPTGTVDCAAVCGHVGDLCAGRSDIDAIWLDVCRSQCEARVQLQPDVAALEAACVAAAPDCDSVGAPGAPTPTAPVIDAGAGADHANQGSDAAADAADAAADRVDAAADRVDAASADTGFGPSAVRATIDGVPVIFDNVTTVSLLSDVVSIIASTGDGTATIKIYTASGTGGNVRLAPSSYGCTGSDIGHIIYTVTEGGPDAGPGTTYGDTGYNSSPCSVSYTRADFTRVQGTFAATSRGPAGSKVLANGVIDVAYR
jgi:hypothetical protein